MTASSGSSASSCTVALACLQTEYPKPLDSFRVLSTFCSTTRVAVLYRERTADEHSSRISRLEMLEREKKELVTPQRYCCELRVARRIIHRSPGAMASAREKTRCVVEYTCEKLLARLDSFARRALLPLRAECHCAKPIFPRLFFALCSRLFVKSCKIMHF